MSQDNQDKPPIKKPDDDDKGRGDDGNHPVNSSNSDWVSSQEHSGLKTPQLTQPESHQQSTPGARMNGTPVPVQPSTFQFGGVVYNSEQLKGFQEAMNLLQLNGDNPPQQSTSGYQQNQRYLFETPRSEVKPFQPSSSSANIQLEARMNSTPYNRIGDDLSLLGASATSTFLGKPRRVYFPTEDPAPLQQPDDDDYVPIKRSDLNRLLAIEELFLNTGSTYNQRPSHPRSSPQQNQSRSSFSSQSTRQIELVTKPSDLKPLGKFEKLDKNSGQYKIIEKYVMNSHDIAQGRGGVKVHGVYALQREDGGFKSTPSKGQQKGAASGKTPKGATSPQHKMLLFWKTSPKGIQKLAENKDKCIAFYDRIARAFAIPPKDLTRPLRQIILLCSVSLGKKENSRFGYTHHSKQGHPKSSDSIKGTGKLSPIWEANEELEDGLIVPAGRTKEHGKFGSYELQYSEYLVWESRRIKPRFAVDVEVECREETKYEGRGRGSNGRASTGEEGLFARLFGGGGSGSSSGANGGYAGGSSPGFSGNSK